MITRRTFLGGAAALAGAAILSRPLFAQTAPSAPTTRPLRYKISASELMPKMGTKVGFLPIIGIGDQSVRANTVQILQAAGALADKAGVILGLNTSLDADGNKKLLDDIPSPAVRIAYNCGEAVDAHRD